MRRTLLSLPLLALGVLLLAWGAASHPVEVLVDKGVQLYRARDFAEAETAFAKALDLEPKHVQARIYLARTLIQRDQVPRAIQQLRILLELHADNPQAP